MVLCMMVTVALGASKKKRDYYDVLGVPKDATQKLIKKAFHRLAKETQYVPRCACTAISPLCIPVPLSTPVWPLQLEMC